MCSFELLGRDVMRRAHRLVHSRQCQLGRIAADQLGQAEIDELHFSVRVQEHIFRFDVAMNDVAIVGVLKRLANLGNDFHDPLRGNPPRFHFLAKVRPFNQFHEQIEPVARVAKIVNGDDVWMLHAGERRASRTNRSAKAGSEFSVCGSILRATSRSSLI